MNATSILILFVSLKFVQHVIERILASANHAYCQDDGRLSHAQQVLKLDEEDIQKTKAYNNDKFRFASLSTRLGFFIVNGFLVLGSLGWIEAFAIKVSGDQPILTGLIFFLTLGFVSMVFGLPFELYRVFKIEEKHGFNRQTVKGFFSDRAKGLVVGLILGSLILTSLLWIMGATGEYWWVYAWIAMSVYSVLTQWLYPALLAPWFNKFSPVTGELSDEINTLAKKVGFETDGIYTMDASVRSSHGNAYFSGVFGKKRIVLFDTLIEAMSIREVVAVLAHELGHFKLKHVRWMLVRSLLTTGLVFFFISLCLPLVDFYHAFSLKGVSNYGALLVFGMWFGFIDFLTQPLENYLSRRNEFAADSFAQSHIEKPDTLGDALLKLRKKSNSMPIAHPWFSTMYHSHPPILERLEAMGHAQKDAAAPV